MEETQTEARGKKRWVPPKVLATYTNKELGEMMNLFGVHGNGGASCGCGSILGEEPPEGLDPYSPY